jgi:hypothetical protein
MVGKLVHPILLMLILTPAWDAQTKSAGQMTARTICESAGYIIKSTPGDKSKPYGIPRTVSTTNTRVADIQSGCRSSPGTTPCRTDRGVAQTKRLRLTQIKINNADKYSVIFGEFAGR